MNIDDFLSELYEFVPAVASASWSAARTAACFFAIYFVIAMLLAPSSLGFHLRLGDVVSIVLSGLFWCVAVPLIAMLLTMPATL